MTQPANSPADSLGLEARIEAIWPVAAWRDLNAVVAVSGGADSVALLRALQKIKGQHGGNGDLFVAHVNHHLRGKESDLDQSWLEQQCQTLNMQLMVADADAAAVAATDGDGQEAAARKVRYRLLAEIAESVGARFVAVGHHRDDQVETVLFRLFRGAGLHGLVAMRPFRSLTPSVSLVRPLLSCTSQELRDYLDDLGQAFRIDASNADATFKRNRLRQEVLPLLREHFNPEVDAAICRARDQLAAAAEVIDRCVQDLLERCRVELGADGSATMLIEPLLDQSEFLAIEVVRHAWREASLPEQGMTERHWKAVFDLIAGRSPARLQLPGGVQAWVEAGRLHVHGVRCTDEIQVRRA
ncbi:tRNA lysidine(34) synthetase TilS [Pirellulales bacterium]|nr:tRNA lysidine(34) synthetase TilS [Pirellulales bacterium]